MPTLTRVRRKHGPALAWTPTRDSYYELAQKLRSEGRLPLYLTQAAILEFEAHLQESSLPLPFGLLAGDVCVCPQTKLEYLLVDTVARARVELGGDDPYAQLAEELQSLASAHSGKGKAPIGWYLGGLADDLTLDDDVTRLHEQLFPERWQLALVRGAASGAERGAFLRYEAIWRRWYSIPFFECLTERAAHKKGERRTAIRWENYHADEPARPLDESEASVQKVDAAPRPSWAARLFGAPVKPVAPSSAVTAPATHATPLEIAAPRRRAPAPPPVQPSERQVAVPVVDEVTAPIERKRTAPVERRVTAPVDEMRTAPIAQMRTASVEQMRVATVEEKVAAPQVPKGAATIAPTVASPADTRVVREAPAPDVQHIFIDGALVPAPLPSERSQEPAMPPGADRVSRSLAVVGALLLLLLVSFYLVAT
jgi:hypothetical protein